MRRRTFIAGLGGAGALVGAFAIGSRRDDITWLLSKARTSSDSRWYPFTRSHAARLGDLSSAGWNGLSADAINNRHLVDLRDIESPEQLTLKGSRRLISRTEAWELSAERPELANDVGYPSIVRGPDSGHGSYYLYYAIHDPDSGIGLAVAPNPDGPYRKAADLFGMPDSRVLRAPPRPRLQSHFSSPVTIWNAERKCWHLYFHFYENRFEQGQGHQRTALATSTDLRNWRVMTGKDGGMIAVLPTTAERWMNSQSTYHAIMRLPNGLWLAWLRGIGGGMVKGVFQPDTSALGLAVSDDGIRWALVPGSPQLVPGQGPVKLRGVIRPAFMAMLKSGLHCCWIESEPYDEHRRFVMAKTTDFRDFSLTSNPLTGIVAEDGVIAPWRSGSRLLLANGSAGIELDIGSDRT